MEQSMIIRKELDDNSKILGILKNLKRKYDLVMPSSSLWRVKKMKLKNTSGSCRHLRRSLLRCYSNFFKTGPPHRILANKMGEWIDLPHEVVEQAKKEFQLKKGAVEVEMNGRFTLDFIHMLLVDMETGMQASIAWIDETGKFFFPEIVTESRELSPKCLNEDAECEEVSSQETLERNNIKLEIDLDINLESMGESNHPTLTHKPAKNSVKVEIPVSNGNETCGDLYANEQKVFLLGMNYLGGAKVLDVQRCSSVSTPTRLELFEKQIELTRNLRGEANVRYGWFACSEEAIPKISLYGLGHCMAFINKPSYEFGVRLSAEHYSYTSVNSSDVDENGVRNMVFCRVILGSMEIIDTETKPCLPSSENFDSGVDDLHEPKNFFIWKTNLNTHIHPEFAVTFKLFDYAEGFLAGISRNQHLAPMLNAHSFPVLNEDHCEATGDSFLLSRKDNQSPIEESKCSTKGEETVAVSRKKPKSAYLPFPVLFDAFSSKVSADDMQHINTSYELFKANEIPREEFVRRLRTTVGDSVLKTTILSLPRVSKDASNYAST